MNPTFNRRTFLKVLGGATAAFTCAPLMRAFAAGSSTDASKDEFFVIIHASGGWDVTLWSDPRNQRQGLIDPATTDDVNSANIRNWVDKPLPDGTTSFELVQPAGSNLVFGPAVGNLVDIYDRVCLINGIEMATVAHPDGTAFSLTGRHLAGGRAVASSVDAMVTNELGVDQLFPLISVNFPASFVGGKELDARATPLRVSSIGSVALSLKRSNRFTAGPDRDAVTALLTEEAQDLAGIANDPTVPAAFGLQLQSLTRMLGSDIQSLFSTSALKAAHPEFNYNGKFQNDEAVTVAFAVEAMKSNVLRTVSLALGGLDTHNSNYQDHPTNLQEIFDLITQLVKTLDVTPHPTLTGDNLGQHTHILVASDFCRTPQINPAGGRDHYPNNSVLIISPRFKGNFSFGQTDQPQLLPVAVRNFSDGMRAATPADVLTTFVSAFGIDPRKYLRDGEVITELLR
jgi:uncharacterized protein (DUF1501 family)